MLGKKSSLAQLKEELRHQKVAKFSSTEFCQGKTMRWGLAWTFDSSVTFPRSEFEGRKAKPPLLYVIPKGSSSVEYKVHELARHLRQILESIKVHCYQGKQAKSFTSITLTAAENTWCNQRRLRRQQKWKNSRSATESQQQDNKCREERKDESSQTDNDTHQIFNKDTSGRLPKDNKENSDMAMATEKEKPSLADESSESHITKMSQKRSLDDTSDTENGNAKRLCTEISERGNGFKDHSENSSSQRDKTKGNESSTLNGINSSEVKHYTVYAITKTPERSETDDFEAKLENGQKVSEDPNISKESKSVPNEDEAHLSGIMENVSEVVPSTSFEVPSQPKEYILKCVMRLKRSEDNINLELEWLDGKSRELMHQVFTFLKNKLAQI